MPKIRVNRIGNAGFVLAWNLASVWNGTKERSYRHKIDDIIEDMLPYSARTALEESVAILLGRKETKFLVYQADNQVPHIMALFRDHCSNYLTSPMAAAFFIEASNVCKALIRELEYRHGGESARPDLDTYLEIRTHTIGISPFCVLIRGLYGQMDRDPPIFLHLQKVVSLTAGLQNDFVGLEKDLRTGESMNAVVVALGAIDGNASETSALQEATAKISDLHNRDIQTIFQTLESCSEARATKPSDEMSFMHIIAAFAQSHLVWCTSGKRYRADIE